MTPHVGRDRVEPEASAGLDVQRDQFRAKVRFEQFPRSLVKVSLMALPYCRTSGAVSAIVRRDHVRAALKSIDDNLATHSQHLVKGVTAMDRVTAGRRN